MKTILVIPTYNERRNIEPLLSRCTAFPFPLDLLFVDDGSPDGTGELLESLRPQYPGLRVMHRPRKMGLGTAYRQAFHFLLSEPYDRFVAMDADLSHSPESIVQLLSASDQADLVIGSRYVRGGGSRNWSRSRQVLSRMANFFTRGMLGMDIQDATSGFRCYRRELLSALAQTAIRSNGYAFQVEMTYYSLAMNFRVREVPIIFEERTHAQSKMGGGEIAGALKLLVRLWCSRTFRTDGVKWAKVATDRLDTPS